MRYSIYSILLVLCSLPGMSQREQPSNASEILHNLERLNFLGTALYVAAHPDDENTSLIAWLANEKNAHTAYLAMTRGDGGQNLIGPEIREGLGIIRTQELLAARRIDGGQQFFTRANDFGYSKTAEETLEIWNEEQVLSDVVLTFRRFRPDIVITRFPPDERAGHGHHTTSAILAQRAFDLSGDETSYPDQLKDVEPWSATRIFTNTGRWWNPDMDGSEEGVLTVNVGDYNELLGTSYTEMSALSRSQHKSQGFGATGRRGNSPEYLEFVKGEPAEEDLFEGIDTSWSRVDGGKAIGKMVDEVIENFDSQAPYNSVPEMLEIRNEISALSDEFWKQRKLRQVDGIIGDMLGLYFEARASEWQVVPGEEVEIELELIQQSPLDVRIESISSNVSDINTANNMLSAGEVELIEAALVIPGDMAFSQPYWLKEKGSMGMYTVTDPEMLGKPQNDPSISFTATLSVNGSRISYETPLQYRWNDPVMGEKHAPLVIAPPVFVDIKEAVYLFPNDDARQVEVTVKAGKAGVEGSIYLSEMPGWTVSPDQIPFSLKEDGEEITVSFNVTPPEGQDAADIKAIARVNGSEYDMSLELIEYDHIPRQVMMPEADSRFVHIPLRKRGDRVGYIAGAGDAIPSTLREIGYQVWEMTDEDINPENLNQLDAVILGIRALNTNNRIAFHMPYLLDYVKDGGTLIIQYNTTRGLNTNDFAPYPLELSRGRVSEENAPVRILNADHPVLNTPNKITMADFDGWVQERGLYFPEKWDDRYSAVIASHDKGEDWLSGGLLVAPYGKGYYIYTGYSWFRELPAGVPGAIRLFTNLVSLGNEDPEPQKEESNE